MLQRRRLLGSAALIGIAAVGLALPGCSIKPSAQAVPAGASVLALGDSLTSGVGATPETAYPALLEAQTGWKVVNAGVSGNTSAQALERLPALLQAHQPALVIVSIGGNDFLRRMSAEGTRTNIRQICEQARASGAQVLLVAVPGLTLMAAAGRLSDHEMYADLAKSLKLPLHADGWSTVLADASLRADSVHANAAGYARFTDGLVGTLLRTGLLLKR
jgi:acyl-CoA thioesterase I